MAQNQTEAPERAEEIFPSEKGTPKNQTLNQEFEKKLIKAILMAGRVLVYADEVPFLQQQEGEDMYLVWYGEGNDSNVLTLPNILGKLDEKERKIFRHIYGVTEEMDIDLLSKVIEKYIIRKEESCTTTGHVWKEILEQARKYFHVQEDYSDYNYMNYSGTIKYYVKDDNSDLTLGTIVLSIDYCNECIYDPMVSIGIQKCTKYTYSPP